MQNNTFSNNKKYNICYRVKNFIIKNFVPKIAIPKNYVQDLTVSFLGASGGTVTGSKYLIEGERKKILIDCGLFQGLKELRLRNREPFPIHPSKIDAIVLTHAHLDHSGFIPALMAEGFKGKVYCTKATFDLCKILLLDSGYLQEEEARYAKKRGYSKHRNPKPLYTKKDAQKSLNLFVPVNFHQPFKIGSNIECKFDIAGHILGAGNVHLTYKNEKTILFSGDVGRFESPIMYAPKMSYDSVDYVFTESTYGSRLHKETDADEVLIRSINRAIALNGKVIIPAFSVGRSQKILYFIYKLIKEGKIPRIKIYLDSPMAIKVTHLLAKYPDLHRLSEEECNDMYDGVIFTASAKESKKINDEKDPCIIVSASGMVTGGRILHHLANGLDNENNTVIFAGYQARGTRGRTILDGEEAVKIHGELIPVRAKIERMQNMSAHADADEIIQWLSGLKKAPRKVFVVHGEDDSRLAMSKKIQEELGWECVIPDHLQSEKL